MAAAARPMPGWTRPALAPRSSSVRTTSTWPWKAARWRAEPPRGSVASGAAPASSKAAAAAERPSWHRRFRRPRPRAGEMPLPPRAARPPAAAGTGAARRSAAPPAAARAPGRPAAAGSPPAPRGCRADRCLRVGRRAAARAAPRCRRASGRGRAGRGLADAIALRHSTSASASGADVGGPHRSMSRRGGRACARGGRGRGRDRGRGRGLGRGTAPGRIRGHSPWFGGFHALGCGRDRGPTTRDSDCGSASPLPRACRR
mmetsp:Transcript_36593/g.118010  ORF Transcript_36593/g.118010 Transcript_36593/m.118010 type:complete len:259 (+) Transcript_36593:726-1502(+)